MTSAVIVGQRESVAQIMNPAPDNQRWFALQVRTRWEGSTALLLSGKGYQTFLPTYKTRKRWKGRVQWPDEVLVKPLCLFDLKTDPFHRLELFMWEINNEADT